MSRRGDLVTVVLPGGYGKPRPGLVVGSDLFAALPSITICPLTSMIQDDIRALRPIIEPTPTNGLRRISQIVTDKVMTVPRSKIGGVIGRLELRSLAEADRALATYLAIE